MNVELSIPEDPLPLSAHRQYHLSRVIQEALTNCLKHSQANRVRVAVSVTQVAVGPPVVTAVVEDNGQGFELSALKSYDGHGLRGMSERMVAFDGSVDVHAQPGHGTRVTAELVGDLEGL